METLKILSGLLAHRIDNGLNIPVRKSYETLLAERGELSLQSLLDASVAPQRGRGTGLRPVINILTYSLDQGRIVNRLTAFVREGCGHALDRLLVRVRETVLLAVDGHADVP